LAFFKLKSIFKTSFFISYNTEQKETLCGNSRRLYWLRMRFRVEKLPARGRKRRRKNIFEEAKKDFWMKDYLVSIPKDKQGHFKT